MTASDTGPWMPDNRMLWLLKASWLAGDSPRAQLELSQMIADYLEERGRLDEAALLRGGAWWMLYEPGANKYVISATCEQARMVAKCWIIHASCWGPYLPPTGQRR